MAIKTDPLLVLDGFMEAMIADPVVQQALEDLHVGGLVDPGSGITPAGRRLLEGLRELDVRWAALVLRELEIAAWWWMMTAHEYEAGPRPAWTSPRPSERHRPPRRQLVASPGRPKAGDDPDAWHQWLETYSAIPSVYDEVGAPAAARATGRRWGRTLYHHDVMGDSYAELTRRRGLDPDRWHDIRRDVDGAQRAMVALASPGADAA